MFQNVALFILAFVFLWVGSGLVINSINKISHRLHMSSFFLSFFVLGFFTSITEIMVGVTAVIDKTPEIFIGNLVGGSVVIFLLIIPLLAVVGNGVGLNHSFNFKDLVSATLVVGFPALLTMDNRIGIIDAFVCIIIWGYFVFMMEKQSGSIDKIVHINIKQSSLILSFLQIIAGIMLIFFASNILVEQTIALGTTLNTSPYLISILILSIGTNIPEISIAVHSIILKRKDIAFGNYVGSAALNTLELGVLSLITKTPVPANGSNYSVIVFLLGLAVFVYFVKSRNTISRMEGALMLSFYTLFVFFELLTGPGWVLLK